MKSLLEYEIYLPASRIKDGKLTKIRSEIVSYFGGLTDTRHKNRGLWKVGSFTIKDSIVVWRVLSSRGRSGDRWMARLRKNLEALLDEQTILLIRRRVDHL